MDRKQNILWIKLFLATALFLSGCESPVRTYLIEENPPKFSFNDPERISELVIFQIPKDHEGDYGYGDAVINRNNVVWEIRGRLILPETSISYGSLPEGMVEKTPEVPLVEGGHYFVWCSQNGNGGCLGTSFLIKNGKAERRHRS
ncbi:MAG: hypothetical protein WAU45_06315 [Blastocatellia bacterium]